MADGEKFDVKKLLAGFASPITWSKSLVYMAMIVIVLFAALTVYRAYFMKNQQQRTVIRVASGGTANITNVQIQEVKRKWWKPIPYVSMYGEARGTSKTSFEDIDYGYGGQVGIRWDF